MKAVVIGNDSYNVIRIYRNRFAFLISFLVLVILSSSWFVKATQEHGITDAKVINLAGKQRALMQKIARLLSGEITDGAISELSKAISELKANQSFITQQKNSPLFEEVEAIYLQGSPSLNDTVLALADASLDAAKKSSDIASTEKIIGEIDKVFLLLDAAVSHLDEKASSDIKKTIVFLYIEMAIALIIVILLVLLIYKPMDRSIVEYLFDISNRKKVALHMLDNTPEATVSIDGKNAIMYFSKRAEELWGYCASEVLGKDVSILVPEEMRSHHGSYIEANRKTGVSKVIDSSRDIELRTKSGELKYCILHIAKSLASDGMQGYTAFIRDVTEDRARQRDLDEARKISFMQSKLAAIGELAAGVAHEINNPLAVIRGYAEMGLMKSNLNSFKPSENTKYFEELLKQTDRIIHIVNGMKNISRMENNDEHLSIENLSDICSQTVDLLKTLYSKSKIEIVHIAPEQPVYAYGNLISIQQILINLINNAKDATEDVNYAKVEVSLYANSEEAIISVKDNGEGIKQENIAKLFEPFFTTKPVGKGTGLGLSIINRLLKNISGTIEVSSEINKGTTFTVRLKRVGFDKEVA
ncbi:MAG TPA: ATP-binding protein [Rheinheimera sp.]|nr:ATP-binding protein [Rheinheimera sp.]